MIAQRGYWVFIGILMIIVILIAILAITVIGFSSGNIINEIMNNSF